DTLRTFPGTQKTRKMACFRGFLRPRKSTQSIVNYRILRINLGDFWEKIWGKAFPQMPCETSPLSSEMNRRSLRVVSFWGITLSPKFERELMYLPQNNYKLSAEETGKL